MRIQHIAMSLVTKHCIKHIGLGLSKRNEVGLYLRILIKKTLQLRIMRTLFARNCAAMHTDIGLHKLTNTENESMHLD